MSAPAGALRAAVGVAGRLGVEGPLRAVHERTLPRAVRRDRADTAHVRRLVAWALGPDDVGVDVGAHRGGVLRELVRIAPAARHVAYEPLPWLAAELAAAFPFVDVRARALSDRTGEARFTHVVGNPGWSGFRRRPTPGAERFEELVVPVEPLDALGLAPRLVKVDVEGAEREVLAGALGTLTEHRPVVVFEHGLGSADHYGTTPDEVFELLVARARLRIFDLDGGGPYGLAAFRRVVLAGERVNFVAHR